MIRTMVARIFLCIFFLATLSLEAQEFWYQSYEKALQAIEAKDWASAESLLLSAKSQQSKQGKKVRSYGTRFISYLPDYQLGIVYASQGKMREAQAQFEMVKASGILAASDPEYIKLESMLGPNPAEEAKVLVKNAEIALRNGNQSEAKRYLQEAKKKDPSNNSIAELMAKMERGEQVQQLLVSAKQSIDQGQLEAGRRALKSAIQLDPSNSQIKQLESALSAKETSFRITAETAKTLPEIEAVKKSLQSAQTRDRENLLYDRLLADLAQRENTLRAAKDKELRDKKLMELAGLLDKARNALSVKNYASARDLAKQAQATGVDDKKAAAELLKQISLTEYQDYSFKMKQAYQGKNFALARQLAEKAIETGADATEAKNLLKRIDIEENLATFEKAKQTKNVQMAQQAYNNISLRDPFHPKLKEMQSWIAQSASALSVEERERIALISFYQGSYETANQLLTKLESEQKKSPRVYFYLGCANAAMAFMKEKKVRDQYLKKAEQLFAQVRALDPKFSYDDRFISPRILKIYQSSIQSN